MTGILVDDCDTAGLSLHEIQRLISDDRGSRDVFSFCDMCKVVELCTAC